MRKGIVLIECNGLVEITDGLAWVPVLLMGPGTIGVTVGPVLTAFQRYGEIGDGLVISLQRTQRAPTSIMRKIVSTIQIQHLVVVG